MAGFNLNSDIDAVITWVDGNDPKHKAKLNNCLDGGKRENIPGADITRFGSINEIKYCVLSILKFAPFIRNIYIITDNQNPNLGNVIKELFPNRLDSICIVDHKEIFEGYEQFLPTFNSRTIETLMWRIKGLSDKFIFFNDDFFIVNDIKREDWFRNGRPVLRGAWKIRPIIKLSLKRLLKNFQNIFLKMKDINLKPSNATSQWRSANMLGFKYKFFKSGHTPHAIDRTTLENYFNKNKEVFLKNASYRFRHYDQYNTVSLANHLEILEGNKFFELPNEVNIEPVNRHFNYVDKKIKICEKQELKSMCAQSLDLATKEDREKILRWIENNIKKQ